MKLIVAFACLMLGAASLFADTAATAESLLQTGKYREALPLLLELQCAHEHPKTEENYISAAASALALGQVYRQLEMNPEAVTSLQRAEEILRKHSSPSLLASTLMESGELDPQHSRTAFDEAWEIWKKLPDTPELAAMARLRLAEIQLSMANYEVSRELIGEAMAWLNLESHRNLASCQPARARAIHDLGKWHLVMGDFPQAIKQLQAAHEQIPKSSAVLADLAVANWRCGNVDDSREAFQAACAAASTAERSSIEANLAAALLSWIPTDATAEAVLDQATSALSFLPSENASLSAQLTRAEAQRLIGLSLTQLGKPAIEAWDNCAATLDALEGQAKFFSLADSHPLRRHAAATRWALEAMRNPPASAAFARKVLDLTMAQMTSVFMLSGNEARLAFLDPLDPASPLMALPSEQQSTNAPALLGAFGLSARQQIQLHTMEEWRAALPDKSCLVCLFTFKKPVGQIWLNSVAALILNSYGNPTILDLDMSTDNLVRTLDQLRDQTDAPADRIAQTLSKLGSRLWKPLLEALPKEVNQAFVFLEGPLAALPLPCLRVNDQAVLEGPVRCTFLASPDALFHEAGKPHPLRTGQWLGVNGSNVPHEFPMPVSGWNFPVSILKNKSFPKLSNVSAELEAIHSLNAAAWTSCAGRETTLREALNNPSIRVWHFAGHGAMTSSGKTDLFNNCLLLPGVDLSKDVDHDGLFFGAEIAALDLHHLDLAVLSACDTGRGLGRHGEGSFDIARACHLAGVRDVFVSAAPVQDAVAPALMKEFYRLLLTGQEPPQAAWEAQRTLHRQFPSIHSTGYFRLIRGNSDSP